MRTLQKHTLTLLAGIVISLALAGHAQAQSDNELRLENQRLRDEVPRLQQELDAATERIALLEQEITRLRQSGSTGSAPPVEEERVSVDESIPEGSPRAHFNAVVASYEADLGTLEIGASADSRERRAYLGAVERWVGGAGREFRVNIDWHVRVLEVAESGPRTLELFLQAVDPQYGTELGPPFTAFLPKSRAESIEEHGEDATYRARGTAVADLVVDETVETARPFVENAFVGQFVEYSVTVDLTSMIQDDIEEPEGDDGGTGADR